MVLLEELGLAEQPAKQGDLIDLLTSRPAGDDAPVDLLELDSPRAPAPSGRPRAERRCVA